MPQFVLGALGEGETMTYISPGVEFGAAMGRRRMDSRETQELAVLPEQDKSNTQLSATQSPAPEAFIVLLDSIFSSLFLFVLL